MKIQTIRNYFFLKDEERYSRDPRRRIRKFPRLIILSTFSLCLPWCFIEARWEKNSEKHKSLHKYTDMIFSLQTQLVAIICLYLRMRVKHNNEDRNFISMRRKLGTFRKSLKHHSKENYEIVLGFTSPDKTEIERKVAAQLVTPSPSATARMSQIFLKPYQP